MWESEIRKLRLLMNHEFHSPKLKLNLTVTSSMFTSHFPRHFEIPKLRLTYMRWILRNGSSKICIIDEDVQLHHQNQA